MSKSVLAASIAICLLGATAVYPQPTPLGEPFQVNTTTSGDQTTADATSAGNAFIVVWEDPAGIRGQVLGASGGQLGPEFGVPFTDPYPQQQPRVAGQSDGTFMVQWLSQVEDGDATLAAVRARTFDQQAAPLHDAFVARVVDGADDASIVGQDLAETEVPGRFVTSSSERRYFDADAVGREFNTRSDSDGNNRVTSTIDSGFDSITDSRVQSGPPGAGAFQVWIGLNYYYPQVVHGRRLSGDGAPDGATLVVHQADSYGCCGPSRPDGALADDGSLIVVWNENNDVQVRSFGPNNVPMGDDTVLNEHVIGVQTNARISRGGDGKFLVVWDSSIAPAGATDQSGASIRGRQLNELGAPIGSEFQVNTQTLGSQTRPVVTLSGDGSAFLVAWQSETSDGDNSGSSIRAQRYVSMVLLFSDGFESGDLSAWSAVVP